MNKEQKKARTINILAERGCKAEGDYSKYFEQVYQPPNLKGAKKRGKQGVQCNRDPHIDEKYEGMGKGRTFLVKTYGCQVNVHDTEIVAGILDALGYGAASDIIGADVALINTCTIRESAENRVFNEIGSLKHSKKKRSDCLIGVCGCVSQKESIINKILKSY